MSELYTQVNHTRRGRKPLATTTCYASKSKGFNWPGRRAGLLDQYPAGTGTDALQVGVKGEIGRRHEAAREEENNKKTWAV